MFNYLASVFFLALLFSPCARGDDGVWLTGDLYLGKAPGQGDSTAPATGKAGDCRSDIARKMCLVEEPIKSWDKMKERPCVTGGEKYAKHFEALYDVYPPALKRMFCALGKIYVEREFFGTAYAWIHDDGQGKIVGADMGIRQSVLDQNLDLHTWASWKEQLSFGGIVDSYELTPGLPTIHTKSSGRVNDFLYFVVAHEFGHIFDFTNGVNRFKDPKCPDPGSKIEKECEMAQDSWAGLSWLTNHTPKPENEFAHRKGLCFYWCEGKPLSKAAIHPLYHGLHATNFLSIYATTQPWDDFADSLAYYLMAERLRTRYFIDVGRRRYRIDPKIYSESFAPKFEYIDDFLKRSDIVYP